MEKLIQKIFSIAFVSILVLCVYFNFSNTNKYLYFENRDTTEKPQLNSENLFGGEYFSQLEKYFSDTFFAREDLLYTGTNLNLNIIKRPVVNDLIVKEKTIIPELYKMYTEYPTESIETMTANYKELSEKIDHMGAKFIYVGIPGHVTAFRNEYPSFVFNNGKYSLKIEEDFFNKLSEYGVANLKTRDFLDQDIYKYYNATDHHCSYIGSVKIYEEIINKINSFGKYKLDSSGIELVELDKPLRGSYSRKLFYLDNYKDKAYVYEPDFTIQYLDTPGTKEYLFHTSKHDKDDYYGYDIYMGGDLASAYIPTERKKLPTILIYGDSFTNPLETLLVRNSNNLYSFDFRQYKDETLLQAVERIKPDYVICVRDNLNYINKEANGLTQ